MRTSRFQCVSDLEVVRLAHTGDYQAFDELVYRYRGGVVLAAYEILGSRAPAEDVAQEVFMAAFHSLARLRDPAKFGSWIHAIARNRARRALGDAIRITPTEPEELQKLADGRQAFAHSDALRQLDLGEAVNDLPEDLRTLVILRYGEQWPIARIAIFVSLPVTTVNWRLHQARNRLKQMLLQREEEEHG